MGVRNYLFSWTYYHRVEFITYPSGSWDEHVWRNPVVVNTFVNNFFRDKYANYSFSNKKVLLLPQTWRSCADQCHRIEHHSANTPRPSPAVPDIVDHWLKDSVTAWLLRRQLFWRRVQTPSKIICKRQVYTLCLNLIKFVNVYSLFTLFLVYILFFV